MASHVRCGPEQAHPDLDGDLTTSARRAKRPRVRSIDASEKSTAWRSPSGISSVPTCCERVIERDRPSRFEGGWKPIR
jgi:hypothetical protein